MAACACQCLSLATASCPCLCVSCRSLFPPTQWSAEINAAIASAGFFWLVGESELKSEPVEVRLCGVQVARWCCLLAGSGGRCSAGIGGRRRS